MDEQHPDPPNWNELIATHGHIVLRYLLAMGVPLAVARDMRDTVWGNLLIKWETKKITYIKMPGLATTEAKYLVLRWRRPRGREIATSDVGELIDSREHGPELLVQLFAREHLRRLQSIVESFPETTQRIFELAYDEWKSGAQIAKILGVSRYRVEEDLFALSERFESPV